LPKHAYYAPRNRYKADSILTFFNSIATNNYIYIGLTSKDISTTKNNIADFGVMGLGFCPGRACVASTYRLSKTNKNEQLFKVAIHELGHTQGLVHCPKPFCFMRDAEGKNPTNEEKEFCESCRKHLRNKGWLI
jgi:archaemetzincin